eukprot:TRINITY_DN34303_c0_g1_i1.p1 TRINITY_DN34303_c0_g1~~TRINITY_DN34303_c0_g1_i1.p1  ORF type:complete len:605 (-),score=66.55 TRINITY_DN34303_c0_g1_i1:67-1881(-)
MAPTKERIEVPTQETVRNAVIAKRLSKALHAWLDTRGIVPAGGDKLHACNVDPCWKTYWEAADESGKGWLSFDEFHNSIKRLLDMDITYSLRGLDTFWEAVDTEKTGRLHAADFAKGVYRTYIQKWPLLSDVTLRHLCEKLCAKADAVHRCRGKWHSVFNALDEQTSSRIDFDMFLRLIRAPFPGLQMTVQEFGDDHIRGFWRGADALYAGSLTVAEFANFQRFHSPAAFIASRNTSPRTGKTTPRGKTGETTPRANLDDFIVDKETIGSITHRFSVALDKWHALRGPPPVAGKYGYLSDMSIKWYMLFAYAAKGKAVLSPDDFLNAVRHTLKPDNLTAREALVLYYAADSDGSGGLSVDEFTLAAYRLETDWWPALDEKEMVRAVRVINNAAIRWHYWNTNRKANIVSANWYKIWKQQTVNRRQIDYVDSYKPGRRMACSYNEFVSMLRCPAPGLNIHSRDLSEKEVKGVWKLLDDQRDGQVEYEDFVGFLRKHCENEAVMGGANLFRSSDKSLRDENLPDQTLLSPRTPGTPRTPRTPRAQSHGKDAARLEDVRQLERGWVKLRTPSPAGRDDALRFKFIVESGRVADKELGKYSYPEVPVL